MTSGIEFKLNLAKAYIKDVVDEEVREALTVLLELIEILLEKKND